MEILEDLIQLFSSVDRRYIEQKKQIQKDLDEEIYDRISFLDVTKKECFTYRKNLKEFIKRSYEKELTELIKLQESIVESERKNSKDNWDIYGSELAGDFVLAEVKALDRLYTLKQIINY